MFNLGNITKENNKEHNNKWPYIPDHSYRVLIIGGSESGKTNALLNLISQQDDVDKIFLYAKNLSKTKYEFLIKKCEVDTLFDYENQQQQRITKYCN